MNENKLAERIYLLRKAKGLTLEQVAQKVGVGKSTVRKWETGMIANMKRDKLASLAAALDTTPMFLMDWEKEEEKKNDPIVAIAMRIHADPLFKDAVDNLYKLDGEKLQAVNQMLLTLYK